MSQRFGHFTMLERLGVGGMAEVWKATDPKRGVVVVKRLVAGAPHEPELKALFAREGRLATRLKHPSIVEVFESGVVAEEPYLVMEFVDGVDLRTLLSTHRRLPIGVAVSIARTIAEALASAHALRGDDGAPLNLVHRDVSPSNVLLARDGAVKLCDFGIARTDKDTRRTRTGNFRGKIAYAAPEVLQGAPHDVRSDLFALGVVLYECLTGQQLFAADTDIETIGKVIAGVVPPVSQHRAEVSPGLEGICLTLLSRLPSERFASASEVVEALTAEGDPAARATLAALVEQVPPRPRATSAPAAERARRAWRSLVFFSLAVLVVAGAVLGVRLTAEPDPRPVVSDAPPAVPPSPPIDPNDDLIPQPLEHEPLRAAPVELVMVDSVPTGATVRALDGTLVGTTPWRAPPGVFRVILEQRGFRPQPVDLSAATTPVVLVPLAGPPRSKPPRLKDGAMLDPFH